MTQLSIMGSSWSSSSSAQDDPRPSTSLCQESVLADSAQLGADKNSPSLPPVDDGCGKRDLSAVVSDRASSPSASGTGSDDNRQSRRDRDPSPQLPLSADRSGVKITHQAASSNLAGERIIRSAFISNEDLEAAWADRGRSRASGTGSDDNRPSRHRDPSPQLPLSANRRAVKIEHKAAFLNLAGEPISVVISLDKGVVPTVRDWRTSLAVSHFLAPSRRWVLLFDGDEEGEILSNDAEELPVEDVFERELHAVMRYLPSFPEGTTIFSGGGLREDSEKLTEEERGDKSLMLRYIEQDPTQFSFLGEAFRNDRDLIEAALEEQMEIYRLNVSRPRGVTPDPRIFKMLSILTDIPDEGVRCDTRYVQMVMTFDPSAIRFSSPDSPMRDDEDLIRAGVEFAPDWNFLQVASERLRGKRDFALWYFCQCPEQHDLFASLSIELQQDRSFVFDAVEELRHAGLTHSSRWVDWPAWCFDDEGFIREMGRGFLELASARLKDDGDFVVEMCGCPLRHACSLRHASARVRGNAEIVKRILGHVLCGRQIEHADEELRTSLDVAWIAAFDGGYPQALRHVNPFPKYSREFVLDTIRQRPKMYGEITRGSELLQTDRALAQVVLRARGKLEDLIYGGTAWRW